MDIRAHKGRGALSNQASRYRQSTVQAEADGWWQEAVVERVDTLVQPDLSKSVLSHNQSPDVPFDQSINPYRGCEHGCIYCFARPTHAYLDLSPGLDFESRLFYKPRTAELLRQELSHPNYACKPIGLGTNTDPYQPIEKRFRITRQILETLLECRHPVTIVTKGTLILRDLDLLEALAQRNLVHVMMSVPTLDRSLKRTLEPRAADPARRIRVIRALTERGVPTGVLVAPVIPALTDHHIEAVLQASADAGASEAGYVLLRLPREVAPLFEQWLHAHRPERAQHVLSIMRQMHGGATYDAAFGRRQTGQGPFAELLRKRFELARRRHGLDRERRGCLDCSQFRPPVEQMALF